MPESNPLGEAIVKAASQSFHDGRGHIEIPEWPVDGKPSVIWFKPISMTEHAEIFEYRQGDGRFHAMIRAVIVKSEDADGRRLFTYENELVFRSSAQSAVIMRIADAITSGPKVADAEKNSGAIQTG